MSWFGKVKDAASYLKGMKAGQKVKITFEEDEEPKSAVQEALEKMDEELEEEEKEGFVPFKTEVKEDPSPIMVPFSTMPPYGHRRLESSKRDRWFERRIDSLLKDNLLKRVVPNQRFGELNFKSLYKVKFSDKLFSRNDDVGKREYNVVLVVDNSGSMVSYMEGKDGCSLPSRIHKLDGAYSFCEKLYSTLNKYCNVGVIGFNRKVGVFKGLREVVKEKEFRKVVLNKMNKELWEGELSSGNHDHIALLTALDVLEGVKGKKIVIVLSDGIPSCGACFGKEMLVKFKGYPICGCSNDLCAWLKEVVKLAESKEVIVLGVGIGYCEVTKYYNKCAMVNSVDEMYEEVVKLLSHVISRRVV